jgi:hypothetical protein
VKDNVITDEEILELKKESLFLISNCLAVVVESRDIIMHDHKWGRNKRIDDMILDLYSGLNFSYEELLKYRNRILKNKTRSSILNNKEKFTFAYLVCVKIIEKMIEKSKL